MVIRICRHMLHNTVAHHHLCWSCSIAPPNVQATRVLSTSSSISLKRSSPLFRQPSMSHSHPLPVRNAQGQVQNHITAALRGLSGFNNDAPVRESHGPPGFEHPRAASDSRSPTGYPVPGSVAAESNPLQRKRQHMAGRSQPSTAGSRPDHSSSYGEPLDRLERQHAGQKSNTTRPNTSRKPSNSTHQQNNQGWVSEQPTAQAHQRNVGVVAPINTRPQHGTQHPDSSPKVNVQSPSSLSQQLSSVKFADFNIAAETKRAMMEGMGYEYCFQVQAQSIPVSLSGCDVLAKAKTGSGKTIAFMIPAIESVLQARRQSGLPSGVRVLVLSPTRELASQIHKETEKLLAFHNRMDVMVTVGGVKVDRHIRDLRQKVPEILVATPGRCMELLTEGPPEVQRMFQGLQVLVMDEADTLLDMGFRPQITKILNALPPKTGRQTLLFSATFPDEVAQLGKLAMRPGFQTVDCVGVEVSTNVQVDQHHLVVPMKAHIAAMVAILQRHMLEEPEFKAVVFFPTARMTQMYSQLAELVGFPILEMHSRKSQAHRDKMSAAFRTRSRVMMFSSDVSARGVDYPDVTLVLQVGAASDRAQYIHRVGRTGRAGKEGRTILLLSDYEQSFLSLLKDLPISPLPTAMYPQIDEANTAVQAALRRCDNDNLARAYVTWLGYYRTHMCAKKLPPVTLVQLANQYAAVLGMATPPPVSAQAVGKMGLKGVPGLVVEKGRPGGGRGGGRF